MGVLKEGVIFGQDRAHASPGGCYPREAPSLPGADTLLCLRTKGQKAPQDVREEEPLHGQHLYSTEGNPSSSSAAGTQEPQQLKGHEIHLLSVGVFMPSH